MIQPANTRILVIDDNPDIHRDFQKILLPPGGNAAELARLRAAVFGGNTLKATVRATPPFQVDSAYQGEEGAAMIRAARETGSPYALAFVDMRMPPGWDGLRTIQEIWQIDPEVQIVVCTAYSDHPWAQIEEVSGGSDRLLVLKKPFDAIEVKRLAATLTTKWTLHRSADMKVAVLEHLVHERTAELDLARKQEIARLEELEAAVEQRTRELRRAATHDELTGLPNRALFYDRLSQGLAQAARHSQSSVAVLFIDCDRFKMVNDTFGHEAGDLLLKQIGARLSATLRATDTVSRPFLPESTAARLGGDEFCLLLTGLARHEDAALVAQRLLAELAKPYDLNGREVRLTASVGVAVSTPETTSAEDLVRAADTAMYRAKAAGDGRFVMFDRRMHDEAMQRITIENELRCAIDRGQMRTFFQPVISLTSGRVLSVEALARWEHPDRGCILPAGFIRVAEENGFIRQLGLWVLEQSCREVHRFRQTVPGAASLRLSVNVSGRQLADPRFAEQVAAILNATSLEPSALALEFAEELFRVPALDMHALLAQLRQIGVRAILDDFGTTGSSLGVLHSYDLDGVKIDRSWVLDAPGRRRHAAVIHTIMTLVHNLGMEGIAEGIASIEHVALLQSLGCSRGQGYLFAPPLSSEECEQLLRQVPRSWTAAGGSAA